MTEKESALGDLFLELFPSIHLAYALVAELQSLSVYIVLNLVKKVCNNLCNTLLRMRCLLACVTACKFNRTVLKVTATHSKTYRNTLEFPLCKFESRAESVTVVDLHGDTLCLKFLPE